MNLPTVKIINKDGSGFVIINEADFDSQTMHLWDEKLESATVHTDSTTPKRCRFIKKDGEQCANDAVKDSDYCHVPQHKK